MTAVVSDPSERAALQQRVLRVLALGQVVGGAALASAVTVGAFVVQDILGHDTPWAGTATAVTTTGTGFMSQVLARKMSRHGRRPGLRLGYGLAAVGGDWVLVHHFGCRLPGGPRWGRPALGSRAHSGALPHSGSWPGPGC